MTDINNLIASFNQYIVRPVNAFGLGGFIFDVENDTTVYITAEITDNYSEDNSAIQDHIAVKPKRVTLSNYVGELVYRTDESTNTLLQKAVQKLTILGNYLPKLTAGAAQIKSIFESKTNFKNFIGSTSLNNVTDLWSTVKNLTPPTERQQAAYMYFKSLCEQKILVSLQTPFEYMANMAIESVVAVQTAESKYISEFTITLKEIRFAKTKTIAFDSSKYRSTSAGLAGTTPVGMTSGAIGPQANRSYVQSSGVVNKGNVPGKFLNPLTGDGATNQDILNLFPEGSKPLPSQPVALPSSLGVKDLPIVEVIPR